MSTMLRRSPMGFDLPELFRLPETMMRGLDPWRTLEDNRIRTEEYVEDNEVVVRAERREQKDFKDSFRSEFRYGSFVRTYTLPRHTKDEDVHAAYRDGILEVRVPLNNEEDEPKRITIARE